MSDVPDPFDPPAALRLPDACAVLGAHQGQRPPRILHQFWDRDPPRQISRLLSHCAKVCGGTGIEHRVWDAVSAKALIEEGFPGVVVQAYRTAPHVSMQSDILRLVILYRHWGCLSGCRYGAARRAGP